MKRKQDFETEFRDPGREFRGAPFWAWNGKLDKEILTEQMKVMKEMGFGGYHIHSRIGLETPYLGEEFMDCVKWCNEFGKENDMITYLYDEDKWPSGYGGGFVTKENPEFRARYLLFSPVKYEEGYLDRHRPAMSRLSENGELTLLERYTVELENGALVSYQRLGKDEAEQKYADPVAGSEEAKPEEKVQNDQVWYAYEIVGESVPWFNNTPYVDTLNPNATKRFTELVYDRYKEAIGADFGEQVPTIFTDEPQFTKYQTMKDGAIPQEAGIPYTTGMEEAFAAEYGYSFFDKLPEVFWEPASGEYSEMKYHYHKFITDRFSKSYAGVLGEWCAKNNIRLTGHVMLEDSLDHQSRCVGDAMRSYPYFQQPGIDMLAATEEYNTAKQVQSVVHQQGLVGMTSELYGVTNWDYDFKGHKLQGDWQAVLGVTLRVPHLAWLYMGGESKRDYPAAIDAHSPWYQRYPVIEDHFARVNTVLRRGRADVKIAVLHPIESFWLLFGPDRQTINARTAMDRDFKELTETLLFGLLDFDFINEGLMPEQEVKVEGGKLIVGDMCYEAIVVPKLITIRSTTLAIFKEFVAQGGKILMLGHAPAYVDAKKSDAAAWMDECEHIGFDRTALIESLEPFRLLDVMNANFVRPENLMYQMREEGSTKWLFLAHGRADDVTSTGHFEILADKQIEIRIRGMYRVTLCDTMTGELREIPADYASGATVMRMAFYGDDSVLLKLEPICEENEISDSSCVPSEMSAVSARSDVSGETSVTSAAADRKVISREYLPSVNPYVLEESNVLMLDMAEYALDGGELRPAEEILKLDDQARREWGYNLRTDSFPQPWLSGSENPREHELLMQFEIESEIEVDSVDLAFEGDEDVVLNWNGEQIAWNADRSYVDRTIHRVTIGRLEKGTNILRMTVPFGRKTTVEWCYLLGEFGVKVIGTKTVVTEKPSVLGFGDSAVQGLPFYGGNLIYELEIETPAGDAELQIAHFAAPLLDVAVDDSEWIPMYKEPGKVPFGYLSAGMHRIRIRSYGNRYNTFGQLHNCNPAERYFGPKTWRTTGDKWCYEYRLKPAGVLTAPILTVYEG